jgi:hypothetical protein
LAVGLQGLPRRLSRTLNDTEFGAPACNDDPCEEGGPSAIGGCFLFVAFAYTTYFPRFRFDFLRVPAKGANDLAGKFSTPLRAWRDGGGS